MIKLLNFLASPREINKAMIEFLRQQPQYKLETSLVSLFGFRYNENVSLDLVPVLDGEFLPKKLSELRVETPKKMVLSGTTKYEGLFCKCLNPLFPPSLKCFSGFQTTSCD